MTKKNALLLISFSILIITVVPEQGMRMSSVARYETVAPPIFLLVAYWMNKYLPRSLTTTILILALAVQTYYAYRFNLGLWVG